VRRRVLRRAADVSLGSDKLGALLPGARLEVAEVMESDGRLRARCAGGG
jgi:hypothetical protein